MENHLADSPLESERTRALVAHVVVLNQPKVKTYARTPASTNLILKVRGAIAPRLRTSW